MKKYILAGAIIGVVFGVVQLLVPYIITEPCSVGSETGVCGGSYEAIFYRGWPMANKGGIDVGYAYDQPPITWQTVANIAIIVVMTILLALAAYFVSRRVRFSKASRIVLAGALVLGLALGVAQIFYLHHETRQMQLFDMSNVMPCEQKIVGCGYCPDAQKTGNYCNLGTNEQLLRGWPLTHETYDNISHYDASPKLLLNAVIIITAVLVGSLAGLGIAKIFIAKKR